MALASSIFHLLYAAFLKLTFTKNQTQTNHTSSCLLSWMRTFNCLFSMQRHTSWLHFPFLSVIQTYLIPKAHGYKILKLFNYIFVLFSLLKRLKKINSEVTNIDHWTESIASSVSQNKAFCNLILFQPSSSWGTFWEFIFQNFLLHLDKDWWVLGNGGTGLGSSNRKPANIH